MVKEPDKSERALKRESAFRKRTDAWQQVQAEEAAAAKAEAAKTARLRELRLAKEAAGKTEPAPAPAKRKARKLIAEK